MKKNAFFRSPLASAISVSIFLTLFWNWSLLKENGRQAYQGSGVQDLFFAVLDTGMDFAIIFLLLLLIFSLLSFWKRGFQLAVLIAVPLFAAPEYFVDKFRVSANLMMTALWQSNPTEAEGMITTGLVLWVTVAFGLGAIIALGANRWNGREKSPQTRRGLCLTCGIAAIAVLTGMLFAPTSFGNAVRSYMPFAAFSQSYDLVQHSKEIRSRVATKKDLSDYPVSIDDQGTDDLIVVLVAGETARASSFSLNGYHRDTNPQLAQVDGLVNFPDAWACRTLTRWALPCMLLRSSLYDFDETAFSETSFIPIFRKMGFFTAWLTTEPDWSFISEEAGNITLIARETEFQRFGWMIDKNNKKFARQKKEFAAETLVDVMNDVIEKHEGKRMLIVLNEFGSHAPYVRDYISGPLRKFEPVCNWADGCAGENLQNFINAYDNTIVYTDYFLSKVIESLKDRNALFVYASDHGESLGEDRHGNFVGRSGFFMHGREQDRYLENVAKGYFKQERHIPMMWWASEAFLEHSANARRFANLARKSQQTVSHDNIFHSIVHCAGMRSEAINESLSLCSDGPTLAFDLSKFADPEQVPSD